MGRHKERQSDLTPRFLRIDLSGWPQVEAAVRTGRTLSQLEDYCSGPAFTTALQGWLEECPARPPAREQRKT